jgi:hypothetical protein
MLLCIHERRVTDALSDPNLVQGGLRPPNQTTEARYAQTAGTNKVLIAHVTDNNGKVTVDAVDKKR